ncbi:MAG: GIY-YIG nuclease family protein [Ignavibacteriales bacterium]|nr:GIY-YIG nuclease family protein [Ignavibacteriales bacterium]
MLPPFHTKPFEQARGLVCWKKIILILAPSRFSAYLATILTMPINIQAFDTLEKILQLPKCEYRKRLSLPVKSAIYFVLSRTGKLLYIGISKALRIRWSNHKVINRLDSSPEHGPIVIHYFVTESYPDLKALELALIKLYAPPTNIKSTSFDTRRIPLPTDRSLKDYEVQIGDSIYKVLAYSARGAVAQSVKYYLPDDPPVVTVRYPSGHEQSFLIYDFL